MTDPILSRLVAIPEHASVQVSAHLRDHDAYRALVDEHHATESSAHGNDDWHRWARFAVDDVAYVIHDPQRYDTDPLCDDKRLTELRDMIVTVLDAPDITGPDKVRELHRLTGRMGALVDGVATYPDGTRDGTTGALDVIADLAATPGTES